MTDMAKIIINGSSSAGNQYVIDADGELLMIECAVPLREVWRSINYKTSDIVGCLVSHNHISDHSKYIEDVTKKGIMCYSNADVINAHNLCNNGFIVPLRTWVQIGRGFLVYAFECPHDVMNYGYIIKHKAFGSLFFGTDCWNYPTPFLHVDHFLIEANYRDDLIEGLDPAQMKRLVVSHMSLDYCIKYLHQCKAEESAKTITLIHLSSRHSNAEEFKQQVMQEFGVPTYIADKGVVIDISNAMEESI